MVALCVIFKQKRNDNLNRFISVLQERDVPRLRALLSANKHRGVVALTAMLALAADHLYSAKGFTDKDHELSMFCLRTGGQSLMYTLNKALHLPIAPVLPDFHYKLGPSSLSNLRIMLSTLACIMVLLLSLCYLLVLVFIYLLLLKQNFHFEKLYLMK